MHIYERGTRARQLALLCLACSVVSCQADLFAGTANILFVGTTFLNGGLGVPNITAEVLQSLAGVSVVAKQYAAANTSWVQHAAEAVTPGSTLYTLLGKGGTAGPWDYVVLQEDSTVLASCASNSTLAQQEATALASLIQLADLRNASSVVILPPAEYPGLPALASSFAQSFRTLQAATDNGSVAVVQMAAQAVGRNISLVPTGLAYGTIYDLAINLASTFKAFQLPAGTATPLLLYEAGYQLPSDIGSYLVGLTVASTMTGCQATGSAIIPLFIEGTLWPNLLQSASDNIIFDPITSPANYPPFPWTYKRTVCTP